MKDQKEVGGIDWHPDWEGADLLKVEALEAEALRGVGLFRRMRQELGLTQAQVAQLLTTTQAAVSKMERRDVPAVVVLRALAAAGGARLKVTLETNDGRSVDLSSEFA